MTRQAKRTWRPAVAALLVLGLASAPKTAGAQTHGHSAFGDQTHGLSAFGGPTHGLSAFGDLKYKADFQHFDWVNPDAPKGGRVKFIGSAARNTFDSFNGFILKGDAAQGL